MELTKYERESVVNWNQADNTATVYTHDRGLMKRLDQLTEDRPEEVQLKSRSHGGQAGHYIIPKTWVKIRPPRQTTEAQRAAARAALLKARSEAK